MSDEPLTVAPFRARELVGGDVWSKLSGRARAAAVREELRALVAERGARPTRLFCDSVKDTRANAICDPAPREPHRAGDSYLGALNDLFVYYMP